MLAQDYKGDFSVSASFQGVWKRLSFARRFAVLSVALSIMGTLALGTWVSIKIEQTAVAREAGSAAVYIGHFVSPILQRLAHADHLSQDEIAQLGTILDSAAVRLRATALKVWNLDGRIIYSSNPEAIGKIFPIDEALAGALGGAITAEFDDPGKESTQEHVAGSTLIEIYAPIREDANGRIIAVAEFYENADELATDLKRAKAQSWLVTVLVLVSIFAACSTVVGDGSRTIDRQQRELTQRVAELSDAIVKKQELRERIERGARKVMEEHERFLRQVGSDLHDGPAQLISFALLRLNMLLIGQDSRDAGLIRSALSDALQEIRTISAGILLPSFANASLGECLTSVVRAHEAKTETSVEMQLIDLPADCPSFVKICLCRFLQEGLANAFSHAGRVGHGVVVKGYRGAIMARVTDCGPGISDKNCGSRAPRLGLIGLKGRVESIRGRFMMKSSNMGTVLTAWIPLEMEYPNDE